MIVDESVMGLVISSEDLGWKTVRESLAGLRSASKENHKLDFGGTYLRGKIGASATFKLFVASLASGGRLRPYEDSLVDVAEAKWVKCPGLKCDTDHWALALADVSGTRLITCNDNGLKADFEKCLTPRGTVLCPGTVSNHKDLIKKLRDAAS